MEIQRYLGKRVLVPFPERDDKGKLTEKTTVIGGICTVEPGPNPHLDVPLQICVDKTPVRINSLNDITIVDNENLFNTT